MLETSLRAASPYRDNRCIHLLLCLCFPAQHAVPNEVMHAIRHECCHRRAIRSDVMNAGQAIGSCTTSTAIRNHSLGMPEMILLVCQDIQSCQCAFQPAPHLRNWIVSNCAGPLLASATHPSSLLGLGVLPKHYKVLWCSCTSFQTFCNNRPWHADKMHFCIRLLWAPGLSLLMAVKGIFLFLHRQKGQGNIDLSAPEDAGCVGAYDAGCLLCKTGSISVLC